MRGSGVWVFASPTKWGRREHPAAGRSAAEGVLGACVAAVSVHWLLPEASSASELTLFHVSVAEAGETKMSPEPPLRRS
jgi:hypothetical protein